MNEEILLTSEEFVKSVLSISDNVAGKYILASIREAQEDGLREIIGDRLLDIIKAEFSDGTLDEHPIHKALVEESQYYLAYMTAVKLLFKVTLKVSNFGVVKSNDENLQVASMEDVVTLRNETQHEADRQCRKLQQWLLRHRIEFPELCEFDWNRMRANLRSAATCGLWLGGARGYFSPFKWGPRWSRLMMRLHENETIIRI